MKDIIVYSPLPSPLNPLALPLSCLPWWWKTRNYIVQLPYQYKLKYPNSILFKRRLKEDLLNFPFFRTTMEERRTIISILMLCLVVGMLVGQSKAGKSDYDKCFDDCYTRCLSITVTSDFLRDSCSRCTPRCELKINKKACFLFWCWQVKWCCNDVVMVLVIWYQ